MIASFNFSFCRAEIYNDYILTIMKEGITVIPKYNDLLLMASEQYYKNKPFVYISNRVNSYSVNPKIHLEMSKIPNLIGFAVISNEPLQKLQARLEQSMFEKDFRLFESRKLAIEWKDSIIQNYLSKNPLN